MKVLILKDDSSYYYTDITNSFIRALEKHNIDVHKIIIFESTNYFLANSYLTSKIAANMMLPKISKRLFAEIESIKPNIVLVIKGAFLLPLILKMIKKTYPEIRMVCYNPDDPFSKYRGAANQYIRNSIKYYDNYFTWKKSLVDVLKNFGAARTHYLPFGADTDIIYPASLDNTSDYQLVSFIGNPDKERLFFLNKLNIEFVKRKSNIPVSLFGHDWPDKNGFLINDAVEGEDFMKTISSSKINLNILRLQNKNSNNMRTFEIPAAGGFMLHEYSEEAIEFFKPGIEADYFKDEIECVDKILFYLEHEDLRKKIAEAGQIRASSDHTYEQRLKCMLENISNKH